MWNDKRVELKGDVSLTRLEALLRTMLKFIWEGGKTIG